MKKYCSLIPGLVLLTAAGTGIFFVRGICAADSARHPVRTELPRVTLNHTDAPVWEILRDIGRQTGISFALDPEVRDQQITVFFQDVSFEEALKAITAAGDLTYEVIGGKNYLFKPRLEKNSE